MNICFSHFFYFHSTENKNKSKLAPVELFIISMNRDQAIEENNRIHFSVVQYTH